MTEPARVVVEDRVELPNGSKIWWLNGRRHRENGPAIEWANGDKEWYLNGQRHRVDGPAVEWADGSKSWWLNDRLHRDDGPAIEWTGGSKEWWMHGQRLTEHAFRARLKDKCLTSDEIKTLASHGIMI